MVKKLKCGNIVLPNWKKNQAMNLKNASVLVVDDDTDVLTAVKMLLKTEVKDVTTEKKSGKYPCPFC